MAVSVVPATSVGLVNVVCHPLLVLVVMAVRVALWAMSSWLLAARALVAVWADCP